jgi:hypothetical protein
MGPTALLPLRRKWCSGFFRTTHERSTLTTSPPRATIIIIIIIIISYHLYAEYKPQTNHVSKVDVTLFPKINVLYTYINTFRSMCTVLNIAVFCSFLN